MNNSRFSSGDKIVLREIWDGKIWSARPMIVVQDNDELIALYIPKNIEWVQHRPVKANNNIPDQRISKQWVLGEGRLGEFYSYLKLVIPGESYSVILLHNSSDDSFRCWYINLEDSEYPIHRTAIGFDCPDMLLDVIVETNLTDWHWEDEDELQEVVEAGLISLRRAKALYMKGEEVKDLIISGKSIFNGWERWRPNPNWNLPIFPKGWDII